MRGGPPYSVMPEDYTGWIGLSWHSTIKPADEARTRQSDP